MKCKACIILRCVLQFALNLLNLLDHAGNTLLLGDANETMSARTARARLAGRKWAEVVCRALTAAARVVTFGSATGDHCTYALNRSVLPNSRQIWDWNTGKIMPVPRTIVDDIEIR